MYKVILIKIIKVSGLIYELNSCLKLDKLKPDHLLTNSHNYIINFVLCIKLLDDIIINWSLMCNFA